MPADRSHACAVRSAQLGLFALLCTALMLPVLSSPARAQAQATTPAPKTTPVPAANAAPTEDDDDLSELAEPPPKPGSSWIGAGLAFGVLNMPKLGVGIELIGELRPRRFWPLAFGLTYWFDNESELNEDDLDLGLSPLFRLPFPISGSHLSVTAYQASAATCPYELALASGALELCAGIEGGVIHVSSAGFVDQQSQTHALFGFDGYVRWHFRLGSSGIGVTYSLGLFVPVLRDRFGYHDRSGAFQEQFRIAPAGGRVDLALAYGF